MLCIYTDESRIRDHIDAAIYSSTISTVTHDHLEKADNTNVYTTKLTTIHLEIKMTEKNSKQYDKCYIYINNQSSIQAIDKSKQ